MSKEQILQQWNNLIARAKGNELSFDYSTAICNEFEDDTATLDLHLGEKKFIIGDDIFNVIDDQGNTLIHLAVKNKNITLAAYLISHGVDEQIQNKNGQTCFELDEMHMILTTQRAISSFNNTIEKARSSKPEISKLNECSDSDFLNVCKSSIKTFRSDIFTPLGSGYKIRDINQAIGINDETLLHGSVLCGKTFLTQELILRGANCNARTGTGVTPLMTASIVGDVAAIAKLYENGATATAIDDQGNNALIAAVMAHKTEAVSFFLKNNMIDSKHTNGEGKTAIDYTDNSETGCKIRSMLQAHELKHEVKQNKKRVFEEIENEQENIPQNQTYPNDPHENKPNHKFYKLIKKSREVTSNSTGQQSR